MVLIVKKLEGWLFMSKKGYSGTPTVHSAFVAMVRSPASYDSACLDAVLTSLIGDGFAY